jgi:hypothetical protein
MTKTEAKKKEDGPLEKQAKELAKQIFYTQHQELLQFYFKFYESDHHQDI